MEPGSSWQLIILLILLLLSAFFSASETALVSMGKMRLRRMLDENIKGAKSISKLLANPDKMITAILIGSNFSNIASASFATAITIKALGENRETAGVAIVSVVLTILVLIFGEITPKKIASQNAEKISVLVVNIISVFVIILTPLITVLNLISKGIVRLLGGKQSDLRPSITEQELRSLLNVGEQEGVLEVEERRMIYNVFDFGDSVASDVMTPRTNMISASIDSSYKSLLEIFKSEKFSRIPIFDEDIDNIVGILSYKDLMFEDIDPKNFNVRSYMREPYFTYEAKSTADLLSVMKQKRIPVTIVLDEYGGTSGLITIEDLVEEIVGEIDDEFDELQEEIYIVKEDEYIIEGSTKLEDVNEMIGTNLVSDDFDSIGGYVIGVLGRFPDKKEEVETDGITFKVEEVDKNKIIKVRVFIKKVEV